MPAARVALVTGGSRGIGRATSARLAADGHRVHFCYRARVEDAAETVRSIEARGGVAFAHRVDLADAAAIELWLDLVLEQEGALHVLVNNAAVIDDRLVLATDDASFERVLAVDLFAPFRLCRRAIAEMLDAGFGRIINVSSSSAARPGPGQSAYAAAKGGLEALTRALAAEVGHKGIRVNAVAPGLVATEMSEAVRERMADDGVRWGTPEDIAELIGFLASDAADYVQGQVIAADGGRSVMRPRRS